MKTHTKIGMSFWMSIRLFSHSKKNAFNKRGLKKTLIRSRLEIGKRLLEGKLESKERLLKNIIKIRKLLFCNRTKSKKLSVINKNKLKESLFKNMVKLQYILINSKNKLEDSEQEKSKPESTEQKKLKSYSEKKTKAVRKSKIDARKIFLKEFRLYLKRRKITRWTVDEIKDAFFNSSINGIINDSFSDKSKKWITIGRSPFNKAITKYKKIEKPELKKKVLDQFIEQYEKIYALALRNYKLTFIKKRKEKAAKELQFKFNNKKRPFSNRYNKGPVDYSTLKHIYNYRLLSYKEFKLIFKKGWPFLKRLKNERLFLYIKNFHLVDLDYKILPFPLNEKVLLKKYEDYLRRAPINPITKARVEETKRCKIFISKKIFASNVLDNSYFIDGKVLTFFYKKAKDLKMTFITPIPYYKKLREIMSRRRLKKKVFEKLRYYQLSRIYKQYIEEPKPSLPLNIRLMRIKFKRISIKKWKRSSHIRKLKIKRFLKKKLQKKPYRRKRRIFYKRSYIFQIKKKFKMYRKYKYLIRPLDLVTISDHKFRSLKLQRLKLKVIRQFYFKYIGKQNLKIICSLLTKTIKYMRKISNAPVFLLETKVDLLLSRLFKVRVIIAQKWLKRKSILINNNLVTDINYLLKPMQIVRISTLARNWRIIRLKRRFHFLNKKIKFFLFFPKTFSFLWWCNKFDWNFFKRFKIKQPYIRRKDAWRLKFKKSEYTLIRKKTLPFLLWDKPIKQKLGY